jgi:large subunit ribosomal protein L19
MSSQIIKDYEAGLLRKDLPNFQPGDTIRVSVKITEGDKERLQDFVGVCIRRRGEGVRESITVRRVSYGVGMERIFPIHSPRVEKIKVERKGRVRRAKLYYLRELSGKKARITELKNADGTPVRPDNAPVSKAAPAASVFAAAQPAAAAEEKAAE